GEGRFANLQPGSYKKVLQYAYENYPGNPNGSPERIAGIASVDGRHVAMMPHPERAVLPYQWAYNPREKFASCDLEIGGKRTCKVMPWVQMFAAAHNQLAY
ncbi:MAG: phosphoribosylformylglycinamidine synthase subunit PurQ, partial [Proteobacteria bacterium]|nr:phosphoribosylformylglycinamidine synthase subunit PurQ [Pseudomonadota bacterium]